MYIPKNSLRIGLILLSVGATLIACGSASISVTPDVTEFTHTYTVNLIAKNGPVATATVACGAGETLVSGGYTIIYNNQEPVQDVVKASFPSDAQGNFTTTPTAWTAQAFTALEGGLVVEAVCIKATFAVSTQAVMQQSNGVTASASCPQNTALTGGGFLSMWGEVRQSSPMQNGTGWTAQYNPVPDSLLSPMTAYAMCLTSAHLVAAPSATATLTIPSDPHPTPCAPTTIDGVTATMCQAMSSAEGQIACGNGQLLFGGGFSNVQGTFYSDLPPGVYQSAPDAEGFLLYENEVVGDSPWLIKVQTTQSLLQGKTGSSGSLAMWGVCLSIRVSNGASTAFLPPTSTVGATTPLPASGKPAPPPQIVATPTSPTHANPTAPPMIRFTISPVTIKQDCSAPPDNTLPNTQIVLDNIGSDVAVAWSAKAVDLLPNSATLWAATSPASGTVPARQKATVTLIPNSNLCNTLSGINPYTFRMVFTYAGSQTLTVTDNVTPFFIS